MTETWSVSPSVDMLPFGVTIPATVPQGSEIPEGLMNNAVFTTHLLFGPKWQEITRDWRKLHSEDLHDWYSASNIIRVVKSRT
jgi:hypothetical protein